MFTAAKLFLSSDLGKRLMLGIAVGLILIATYSMGRSHGYASGHTTGFTEGQQSRNREVNHLEENVAALTKTINDERKAVADKVKAVEKDAYTAAIVTETKLNKKIRERDAIIADYASKTPPAVQESCGLSIETVRAINKLIDNVNEGKHEDTKPDSIPPGDSPDRTDGNEVKHDFDTPVAVHDPDALTDHHGTVHS